MFSTHSLVSCDFWSIKLVNEAVICQYLALNEMNNMWTSHHFVDCMIMKAVVLIKSTYFVVVDFAVSVNWIFQWILQRSD